MIFILQGIFYLFQVIFANFFQKNYLFVYTKKTERQNLHNKVLTEIELKLFIFN